MLFNSFPFAIFFLALVLVLRLSSRRAEAGILLGASLLFYAMWHPVYLLLLVGEVAVNYLLLREIHRRGGSTPHLLLSVGLTLGALGWFKYSAMAIETLLPVLSGGFGLEVAVPDYFLPLGISFYSFQILAMNIDANRGRIKELPSFSRYLLFISFFPQLIAGPIVRAGELLPQLEAGSQKTSSRTQRGVWLLASGAFKKVVMGDFLLAGFVNEVFAHPGVGDAGPHLIAMYAFAFQIYFDFAGYTDMARGLACLLGYELPKNFQEPFLALNPNEFWRRWHITLSNWFRDYVFLPLSLRGALRSRMYPCLLITWTLVGLWHGAQWHFVLWGVYQAAILSLHRVCRPLLIRVKTGSDASRRAWLMARWFGTFNLVAIGLLLFRAESAADAWAYFVHLVVGDYSAGIPPVETALVLVSLGLHVAERWLRENRGRLQEWAGEFSWASVAEGTAVGLIAAMTLAAMGSGGEFIYFQF